MFSFGVRAKNGGYDPAFTFDNYLKLLTQPQRLEPFITSLWMAVAGTIGCLLVGLPLAYFIATRARKRKGLLVLLLVIPFWTSFLIRTYSWLIILGKENIGRIHRRASSGTRTSVSSVPRSRSSWASSTGICP